MSPRAPRIRGAAARAAVPVYRPTKLGEVRRAQLITTYGVGAMLAVDNESFIVSGIDTWNVDDATELWEPRLSGALGVEHFKLPPAPDPETAKDGVRAQRFPRFYSCPGCKDLRHFRDFNPPKGKALCSHCQEDLVPSRFVMACVGGHLDDFPYWSWIHRSVDFEPDSARTVCGGTLSLSSDGATASLRSVIIGCSCGVQPVSMEGAFSRGALRELRIRCTGRRPWLKNAERVRCDEQPRTLQRGSSSAWFPVLHSTLSIPPWSDGLFKALEPHWRKIRDETPDRIRVFLEMNDFERKNPAHSIDEAVDLVEQHRAISDVGDSEADEATLPATPRERLHQEEHRTLLTPRPEIDRSGRQDFVNEEPSGGSHVLRHLGFERIMLVKRLREVRALASFTRVEEPTAADDPARRAQLSTARTNWLPAIEVSGEGVFLDFGTERLTEWEHLPGPRSRADRVRRSHQRLLLRRAGDSGRPPAASPVSPRFLLLHTLAHVLINEWSLDGGYPAASLRERLYIGDGMAGFLIYTATSDSEGSLGGIVAQGTPKRLEEALRSALDRSEWCSNDPLCSEAEASGADSLNLAACHACVLLPETSCELNNTLLDRAALVGTADGEVPGLFRR